MPTILSMQRIGDAIHVTIALPGDIHVTIVLPGDIIERPAKGSKHDKDKVLKALRNALKEVGKGDSNGAGNGKVKSARS